MTRADEVGRLSLTSDRSKIEEGFATDILEDDRHVVYYGGGPVSDDIGNLCEICESCGKHCERHSCFA